MGGGVIDPLPASLQPTHQCKVRLTRIRQSPRWTCDHSLDQTQKRKNQSEKRHWRTCNQQSALMHPKCKRYLMLNGPRHPLRCFLLLHTLIPSVRKQFTNNPALAPFCGDCRGIILFPLSCISCNNEQILFHSLNRIDRRALAMEERQHSLIIAKAALIGKSMTSEVVCTWPCRGQPYCVPPNPCHVPYILAHKEDMVNIGCSTKTRGDKPFKPALLWAGTFNGRQHCGGCFISNLDTDTRGGEQGAGRSQGGEGGPFFSAFSF